MNKFYNEKMCKLEKVLSEMEMGFDCPIQRLEAILNLITNCLSDVKAYVLNNEFKNVDEEISFFKNQKPAIVAKLIYYNTVYKIELKRKSTDEKTFKELLNKNLKKIKFFFDNNLDFYKYYRTNSSYLDYQFFVRKKYNNKFCIDAFYYGIDDSFSTSHDNKVANIIANDLIHIYLENQLNNNNQKKVNDSSILKWTGSKTAMIELIYALHSQGSIDNGNADIKVITKTFERAFNVDLGNFYHTFMELKSRKINRTKFLDSLRDALIRKMDEQDEI